MEAQGGLLASNQILHTFSKTSYYASVSNDQTCLDKCDWYYKNLA